MQHFESDMVDSMIPGRTPKQYPTPLKIRVDAGSEIRKTLKQHTPMTRMGKEDVAYDSMYEHGGESSPPSQVNTIFN